MLYNSCSSQRLVCYETLLGSPPVLAWGSTFEPQVFGYLLGVLGRSLEVFEPWPYSPKDLGLGG